MCDQKCQEVFTNLFAGVLDEVPLAMKQNGQRRTLKATRLPEFG